MEAPIAVPFQQYQVWSGVMGGRAVVCALTYCGLGASHHQPVLTDVDSRFEKQFVKAFRLVMSEAL
jgi:hypothetical protein